MALIRFFYILLVLRIAQECITWTFAENVTIDQKTPLGADVIFLIDKSGSMGKESWALDGVKALMRRMAGWLNAQNTTENIHAALVAFDGNAKVLVPFDRWSQNYVKQQMTGLTGNGGVKLSEALRKSKELFGSLKHSKKYRHIIVITDYEPSYMEDLSYSRKAARELQKIGVVISTLYLNTTALSASGKETGIGLAKELSIYSDHFYFINQFDDNSDTFIQELIRNSSGTLASRKYTETIYAEFRSKNPPTVEIANGATNVKLSSKNVVDIIRTTTVKLAVDASPTKVRTLKASPTANPTVEMPTTNITVAHLDMHLRTFKSSTEVNNVENSINGTETVIRPNAEISANQMASKYPRNTFETPVTGAPGPEVTNGMLGKTDLPSSEAEINMLSAAAKTIGPVTEVEIPTPSTTALINVSATEVGIHSLTETSGDVLTVSDTQESTTEVTIQPTATKAGTVPGKKVGVSSMEATAGTPKPDASPKAVPTSVVAQLSSSKPTSTLSGTRATVSILDEDGMPNTEALVSLSSEVSSKVLTSKTGIANKTITEATSKVSLSSEQSTAIAATMSATSNLQGTEFNEGISSSVATTEARNTGANDIVFSKIGTSGTSNAEVTEGIPSIKTIAKIAKIKTGLSNTVALRGASSAEINAKTSSTVASKRVSSTEIEEKMSSTIASKGASSTEIKTKMPNTEAPVKVSGEVTVGMSASESTIEGLGAELTSSLSSKKSTEGGLSRKYTNEVSSTLEGSVVSNSEAMFEVPDNETTIGLTALKSTTKGSTTNSEVSSSSVKGEVGVSIKTMTRSRVTSKVAEGKIADTEIKVGVSDSETTSGLSIIKSTTQGLRSKQKASLSSMKEVPSKKYVGEAPSTEAMVGAPSTESEVGPLNAKETTKGFGTRATIKASSNEASANLKVSTEKPKMPNIAGVQGTAVSAVEGGSRPTQRRIGMPVKTTVGDLKRVTSIKMANIKGATTSESTQSNKIEIKKQPTILPGIKQTMSTNSAILTPKSTDGTGIIIGVPYSQNKPAESGTTIMQATNKSTVGVPISKTGFDQTLEKPFGTLSIIRTITRESRKSGITRASSNIDRITASRPQSGNFKESPKPEISNINGNLSYHVTDNIQSTTSGITGDFVNLLVNATTSHNLTLPIKPTGKVPLQVSDNYANAGKIKIIISLLAISVVLIAAVIVAGVVLVRKRKERVNRSVGAKNANNSKVQTNVGIQVEMTGEETEKKE